jgi:hypothetical protein
VSSPKAFSIDSGLPKRKSVSCLESFARNAETHRYGEVAVGKAAASLPVTVGNHPRVRIPALSANFLYICS